jgi:PAS domain S-box-containing protein
MSKPFNKDRTSLDKIRSMTEALNCKEHELQLANHRYRAILDHAPIGMLMTSGRIIIDLNKRLEEMLGWSRDCLVGKSTRTIYDTDETFNYVGKLLEGSDKEFSCRVNMRHMNGTIKEYTLKVTKISDEENVASIYIEFRGV